MKKDEFVDSVAHQMGKSKKEAAEAVEAVFGALEHALSRGEEVALTGFGKFHVAHRAPRQGVNPRTRERIQIAGGKVPRFSAGTGLKKKVKGDA